ncbi:hypothetical protein ACVLVH_000390 [Kluyvera sp. 1366]
MRFTPTRAMYLKKYERSSIFYRAELEAPNKTDVREHQTTQ